MRTYGFVAGRFPGFIFMLAGLSAVLSASSAQAQRQLGVDVSAWQGDLSQTTWNNIRNAGRVFAYIRVTHVGATNGDPDTEYADNFARAQAAGILCGAYDFARPTIMSPTADADHFLAYASPYITAGYLRPALDLEEGGGTTPVGATNLSNWANAWLNYVEQQTGVEAIVYCNSNYAKNYLNSTMASRTLWVANYSCSVNPLTAEPPNGIGVWSHWTFWQYCSSLSVGGVSPVDTDVFNGTLADLQTYVIGSEDHPPIINNVQASSITSNSANIQWTTDAVASSQVQYGLTTSYGSTSALDSSLMTSHLVSLSGLSASTLYHYRVISTNANGTTTSSDYTFTTGGPPAVSSVQASNVTASGATITWTTNTASTSQVRYGLTSSYGSLSTLDSTNVTSHSVTLTGLTPSSTYHYQAVSTNAYGTGQSSDLTFTTTGPPTISSVSVSSVDASTATITWSTNVPADSQIQYGLTSSYGSSSTLDSTLTTSHSVTLSGLSPTTTYHYRARSANAAGTVYSNDSTFTTTAVPQELLIDNVDAGCTHTGTWSTGAAAGVPKIGDDYFFTPGTGSTGSTTATCRWTPYIAAPGTYDVYVYYQIGSNRNTAAPFTVVYNGASFTSTQNQYSTTPSQGGWFKLNSSPLPFAAGSSGYVQVANNSTNTGYISADAAKFVLVGGGDTQAPTAPTGVTATAAATTSIQLGWTASTDNVGVSGYKVYRNGTYLATSTTTSYLDSGLTANTSYSYEVSAYDAVPNESAHSSPAVSRATLSVAPVSGSVTPSSSTACIGSTVTWTAAGGFGAGKIQYYRYKWDQNASYTFTGSESTWNNSTLSTTPTTAGSWYLHVQGYNSDNAANGSYNYAISTRAATAITLQPVAVSICPGSTAQFTVAGSGSGTVTYKWQKNGVDLANSGHYSGVTTAILTIAPTDSDDAAQYRCVVTADCGSVNSSAVALTLRVTAAADLNGDCSIDQPDANLFQACSTGPDIGYSPLPEGCTLTPNGSGIIAADFDADGDVDQEDFAVLQRCLTGGQTEIDPNCMN